MFDSFEAGFEKESDKEEGIGRLMSSKHMRDCGKHAEYCFLNGLLRLLAGDTEVAEVVGVQHTMHSQSQANQELGSVVGSLPLT